MYISITILNYTRNVFEKYYFHDRQVLFIVFIIIIEHAFGTIKKKLELTSLLYKC